MLVKRFHRWHLTAGQAINLQKQLACRVEFSPLPKVYTLAAGIDCAFGKNGKKIIAGVVVVRLPDLAVVETATACRKVTFPYIPGLLSFREAPACIAAVRKLKSEPDVFIVDGQGIAHPRRFGLAAHFGLHLDRPTIGCAKSRLIGTFKKPGLQKGAYSLLLDPSRPNKQSKPVIGAVLRTRTNVKPVFVSVGNKCTLKDAVRVCLACCTNYRLPEPARLAHQLVTRMKAKV